MGHGKVTFISLGPNTHAGLSWRAVKAIAEADFVICACAGAHADVRRLACGRADIIDAGPWTTSAMLPFYDLAARDGFQVTHIRSGTPADLLEHVDRCCDLGLETEIVRCT